MNKPMLGIGTAPEESKRSARGSDNLELRAWLRLLACTTMIEQRVRSRLRREFATTLPRFDVLAQLDRAPDGLTMGELSTRLMVSNGNVTMLADRLEQEGLISRSASPRDRRTQTLRLTAEGRRAFGAMTPAHEGWVAEMMAGLGGDEKKALIAILDKLKETLRTHHRQDRSQ